MNDAPSGRATSARSSGAADKERTILVVDDSRAVREFLTRHLAGAGFIVLTAGNGQEALEMSGARTFDLVVCDMHMPGMDGVAFRRAMLAQGRNAATPFLAMSSNDSVDNLRAMQELQAAAFLTKPFKPLQLLMQVERLIAEAALRESEECFRTVADYTLAWEYWIAPDRRMIWMSPSCERVTGYSVEEFLDDPKLFLDIVLPEDRAIMGDHLQHHLQDCATHSLDYRIKTKDGRVRWLAHSCQPVYDRLGGWAGRRASNLDITGRKLAEQALRRSESHLRSILDNSPIAIFLKDTQGNVLVANHRYAELFGLTVAEVVGKRSYDLLPEEAAQGASLSDRKVISTGAPVMAEHAMQLPEGKRFLHWVKFPVKDEAGGVVAIGGTALDISDYKKGEEFRQDVERIMRHDLKSPLNAIITLSSLLLDEGGFTGSQQEMLTHIEHYGKRMLSMLDLSLRLFKMEQGTFRLTAAPMDVVAMAGRVGEELQDLLSARNRRLRLFVRGRPVEAGDTFIVSGDDLLFYSLLSNLVRNALEAAPQNTAVMVSLDEDVSVFLRIHNQGAVPAEVRERFFEKYATAGKTFGTGLGTYAARLIAEAHGGSIYMDTSEEAGTTVTVVLPRG